MIEKLSEKQVAKFDAYVKKWTAIGLSTEKINKEKAKKAVALAYKYAGMKPPQFMFCDSPYAACKILEGNGIADPLSTMVFGFQEAPWLSFYDFFRREMGLKAETEKIRGIMACCEIGWWSPFENVALIQDRPKKISLVDGRLHRRDGKALEYRDGTGLYAWNGRMIPDTHAFIFTVPETITAKMITDEKNAEYRRVMLDVFGVGRYLKDANAQKVDESQFGALYVMRDPRGDIAMVELDNSTPEPDGTRKKYFIPVPATMRTAHEAVAWQFRRTPETYSPEQQT